VPSTGSPTPAHAQVSFAAFAAGRKVEREEARERACLEEIARQRRAEQARLAKLEQQRMEFLDRRLAQAQERDRLRAFLMALPADHISGEASACRAFLEWARQRLEKMEAQLQLATIADEVRSVARAAPPNLSRRSREDRSRTRRSPAQNPAGQADRRFNDLKRRPSHLSRRNGPADAGKCPSCTMVQAPLLSVPSIGAKASIPETECSMR
jgi:hypothetical protein